MSNTLISFLEGFEPTNEVQTLLRNIVILQAKFDNPDESDVFFQGSKDKQAEYLKLAKEKYSLLAETVNDGDLDGFDSHIHRVKDEIKKFTSEHEMNSITGQKVNNLNSQLDAVQSFKQAKEKYNILKSLDELMKDEKALMEIFS
jgi:hypothetical protein